jgi:serine/threonine protein kinase/WD40 repeat protein
MSQASSINLEALSLDQHLDRVCGPFEAACKAALQGALWPRIEDFVDTVTGPERPAFLQELILLDLHYRRRAGQSPEAGTYQACFPDLDLGWLAAALAGPGEAPALPSTRIASPAVSGGMDGPPEVLSGEVPDRLGEFRILREVGRGGMGVVYEAVQESLGRHVALKVLPFSSLLSATHLERFQREARAAARLHHTNIVPVFGVGEWRAEGVGPPIHYYAMQFIEGQGLDRVLREVKRLRGAAGAPAATEHGLAGQVAESLVSGRFPAGTNGAPGIGSAVPRPAPAGEVRGAPGLPPRAAGVTDLSTPPESRYFRGVAQVGVQVAEALAYAHGHGILHRDIKPSNLLLDTAGTVWVADFGLAKVQDAGELTSPGDIVGTLRYMAPERFQGQADPRSDIYSLGLTLYELLTLRPAFEAIPFPRPEDPGQWPNPVPPRQLDGRIPRDLETVVLKAMAPEPADRYATAADLAEDLRRVLADRPIRARRTPLTERLWRWCRRNPAVTGLAASILVLLVAFSVISTAAALWLKDERDTAWRAEQDKDTALKKAEQAEQAKTEELIGIHLRDVRDIRGGGQFGRRSMGLARVDELLKLVPRQRLTPDQVLELRMQVIASLALPDMREVGHFKIPRDRTGAVALDSRLERYAYGDAAGNIHVRRLTGGPDVAYLPAPAGRAVNLWASEFSPDDRWLLGRYVAEDGNFHMLLWDWEARQVRTAWLSQWGSGSAFSPDSRWLAWGAPDALYLYDLVRGQTHKIPRASSDTKSLAFHPSSQCLAVQGFRSIHLLEVPTGKHLGTLPLPTWSISLAWSRDGRWLAAGGEDGWVTLWDAPGRRQVNRWRAHSEMVTGLAFTPAGDRLASCGHDSFTAVFDPHDGRQVYRQPGCLLRFQADGSRLALLEGEEIRVFQREASPVLTILPQRAIAADFDRDGRLLATAGAEGVHVWDLAGQRRLADLRLDQCGTAAFDPANHSLVTFGRVSGLRIWPLAPDPVAPGAAKRLGPPRVLPLAGPQHFFQNAVWSQDGSTLGVVDFRNERVTLFHPDQSAEPITLGTMPWVGRLALSRKGDWVATAAGESRGVWLWRVGDGQVVWKSPRGHDFPAFSPDGQWLVSATDSQYHTWRVPSGEPGRVWDRDQAGAGDAPLAFSADGRLLALTTSRQRVTLVDWVQGRRLATLEGPQSGNIGGLVFSPDGTRLAVTHLHDEIHVWDLRQLRRELARFDLDWEAPSYPPAPAVGPGPAATVHVVPRPAERHGMTWTAYWEWDGFWEERKPKPNWPGAVNSYTDALKVLPLDAPPEKRASLLERRARNHLRLREFDEALVDLREAVAAVPGHASACHALARLCVVRMDGNYQPDVALPYALLAVERQAEPVWSRNTLGIVYYRLEDFAKARTILEQSLAANHSSAAADLFFLAMCHARLGNVTEARGYFDRAVTTAEKLAATLAVEYRDELKAFRAEAETVLGRRAEP